MPFDVGRFTAIVAAVIFADAAGHPPRRCRDPRRPADRHRGRHVGRARTERQLLWKVQLPVARPALLLAANQGLVMVLAMVVVGAWSAPERSASTSSSGSPSTRTFGKGLAAGIAIVLLGIMLDRITQGAGGAAIPTGALGVSSAPR